MRSITRKFITNAVCEECQWAGAGEKEKKESAKKHAWDKGHTVQYFRSIKTTYDGRAYKTKRA